MKSFDNASHKTDLAKDQFRIVFCDNHLLVVIKPANCLTQPDDTGRESLEEIAKEWVKQKYDKPGAVFLHCIHRIDRPVSGLVIFARTSKALSRLNEASRDQLIQRLYTAEVEGLLPAKEGTLEHFLVHGEHRALLAKANAPEAKKAILNYRVVSTTKQTSLVCIELKTGRYHQIRAQFSAIRHPILGDGKYGAKTSSEKIHLACTDLSFPHPVTKERLTFHFDPPF